MVLNAPIYMCYKCSKPADHHIIACIRIPCTINMWHQTAEYKGRINIIKNSHTLDKYTSDGLYSPQIGILYNIFTDKNSVTTSIRRAFRRSDRR